MKTFATVFAVLLLLAATATYARYESFDPCAWMAHDLVEESGLPRMVAEARIQAEFLLRGIGEPDAGDCLFAWWDFRAEGLQKKKP